MITNHDQVSACSLLEPQAGSRQIETGSWLLKLACPSDILHPARPNPYQTETSTKDQGIKHVSQ